MQIQYFNSNRQWHRVGLPAYKYDGNKSWYFNGLEHRINGLCEEYYDDCEHFRENAIKDFNLTYHCIYDLGIKINTGKLVL